MPIPQTLNLKLTPFLLATLALIALTLAPIANAQALTEKTVRSFLDSLKAVEVLAEDHQDFLDALEAEKDDDDIDFSAIFSSNLDELKGHPMYGDLQKVVKKHGFSNVGQWGQTGDRVFRAWFALEMDQEGGVNRQEMQSALAEIENSPHMTEEQKAQMRAMMQSATSAMDAARDAPESDKRAVRPFIDELRAMSEDEDSGW